MATRTKQEQLDLGVPIDPTGEQQFDQDDVQAYTDAFYTSVLGRRETPTNVGFFFARIARTETGVAVAANSVTAALPGPVLNVQATAATSTGPKTIIVTGAPGTGQVLVESDPQTGRDTLTFAAGDAVTVCAYRQQAMPQEMYDQLVADTEPPIDD